VVVCKLILGKLGISKDEKEI